MIMDTRTIMQRDMAARQRYELLGGYQEERRLAMIWKAEYEAKKIARAKAKEALKRV